MNTEDTKVTALENYYTTNETAKLLGVSNSAVSIYLRSELLKGAIKIKGRFFIPEDEVHKLVKEKNPLSVAEIKEKYYNMQEATQLLNISDSAIRKYIRRGRFKGAIKIKDRVLIPKDEIHKLAEEKNLLSSAEIKEKYYNVNEATKILNVSDSAVLRYIKKKLFNGVKKINGLYLIPKDEIHKLAKEKNPLSSAEIKEKYCTVKEAAKILNVSTKVVIRYINSELLKGAKIIKGSFFVPKDEVYKLAEEKNLSAAGIKEKYCTVKEAAKILNVSTQAIIRYIQSKHLKGIKKIKRRFFIPNEAVRDMLERKKAQDLEYYSCEEVIKLFGVSSIYKYIKTGRLTGVVKVGRRYLIPKDEVHKLLAEENLFDSVRTDGKYYTIKEAAGILGLANVTIRTRIKNNYFKGVLRINNNFFIPNDEIHKLLNSKDFSKLTEKKMIAYFETHNIIKEAMDVSETSVAPLYEQDNRATNEELLGIDTLTVQQAATCLGVPETTVKKWVWNGEIPATITSETGIRIEYEVLESLQNNTIIPAKLFA